MQSESAADRGDQSESDTIEPERNSRTLIDHSPVNAVHADNAFPRRVRLQSVRAGLLAFGSSRTCSFPSKMQHCRPAKESPGTTLTIFHSGSLQDRSPITAAGPRRNPDGEASVTVFPFHSQDVVQCQSMTLIYTCETQTVSNSHSCFRPQASGS